MKAETGPLAGLDFTDAAWAKAEHHGHTTADYEGIEPAGTSGEYLVRQVEDVQAARAARSEPVAEPGTEEPAPEGETAEPSAAAPSEPPAKDGLAIPESRWREFTNYHCPTAACKYSSIDRHRVVAHYYVHHAPPAPPSPQTSAVLVDRFNNPLPKE